MISCTFKIMKFYDWGTACLLLFSGILYTMVYVTMSTIAPEIQQATNFDFSSWTIILIVLFAFIFWFSVISIIQWFELVRASNNKIVQELIYILGLWEADGEKEEHLQQTLQEIPLDKDTDSVDSLYGFGHDENEKRTFAGVKPKVAETVVDEKTESVEEIREVE